jgi:carbonic anhydrase/acetyltransferase-like protein (isoleucine patch superfamily)
MNSPGNENIYRFKNERPRLGADVFIDRSACVSGSVELGDDVSVWPMTVIRGDVNFIRIGARSNIQDGCILHVTHEGPWQPDGLPLLIGEDVTVMDGAVLEADCMVAAGAVVTPAKVVSSGTLWRGNPARHARDLTRSEIENQVYNARHYVRLKNLYLEEQE